MYSRYAETKRWRIEVLSENESEQGGFKEIIALVSGDGAYGQLKFDLAATVYNVYRKLSHKGRIHTSACTDCGDAGIAGIGNAGN